MVNKISLALRKVMVNVHNYNNPLKQWEDGIWYYKWVKLDAKSNHYICLAFIPIKIVDLILQKPMDYSWDIGDSPNVKNNKNGKNKFD